MNVTGMRNLELLVPAYEARFGRFPSGDNPGVRQQWSAWLEHVATDDIECLVERVATRWDGGRRPLMLDFQRAYRNMRLERGGMEDRQPVDACAFCSDTGWLVVPCRLQDEPNGHRRVVVGESDEYHYSVAIPCRCTKGQRIAEGHHVTPEDETAAWSWAKDEQARIQAAMAGNVDW